MITLYTFGPYFGLPDGSPFVIKAMLLLKFAGLEYREDRGGYPKAPKGKLPYINDDGLIVADFDVHPLSHREKIRLRFRCRAHAGAEGSGLGGRENVRGTSLFRFGGDALAR